MTNDDLYELSSAVNIFVDHCSNLSQSSLACYRNFVDNNAPSHILEGLEAAHQDELDHLLRALKETQGYLDTLTKRVELETSVSQRNG